MAVKTEKGRENKRKSLGTATVGGHRPVCVSCQVELRPKKNSVLACSRTKFGPTAIWYADLWKCVRCGSEVIMGFGILPVVYHHERDFNKYLKKVDYYFNQ